MPIALKHIREKLDGEVIKGNGKTSEMIKYSDMELDNGLKDTLNNFSFHLVLFGHGQVQMPHALVKNM